MAGGDREARGAAFQRRDAFLQHRIGGVADARIDVAEGLQTEQRRGVVNILEHERGGLIDRRRPCAGGWIGLCARMDGEGGEARNAVRHHLLLVRNRSVAETPWRQTQCGRSESVGSAVRRSGRLVVGAYLGRCAKDSRRDCKEPASYCYAIEFLAVKFSRRGEIGVFIASSCLVLMLGNATLRSIQHGEATCAKVTTVPVRNSICIANNCSLISIMNVAVS